MSRLDDLLAALVPVLTVGTWEMIEADHKKVQLTWRPDLEPGWGKPRYVAKVLGDLLDDEVIGLGQRCVKIFPERAGITVQNALWRLDAGEIQEISEITRLAIADGLDGRMMHPRENPNDFLQRFAVLPGEQLNYPRVEYGTDEALYSVGSSDIVSAQMFFGGASTPETCRESCKHRDLLDFYGFRSWPDKRIFKFLEMLVHPAVRKGKEQQEWLHFINGIIKVDGFQLCEANRMSGHPVFKVQRENQGVRGRPKNLIFASTGPKPELGFRDAVNNDIIVLKHEQHCLLFEDPIDENGLRWNDLVAWWARTKGSDPHAPSVRKEFGRRLEASLGSQVETALFHAYFRLFHPLLDARLPALIPQVYLHYDPATYRRLYERGEDRRFHAQRMDFLMLLPERVRVVLEVDGRHHYSEGDGASASPSPRKYAGTVAADRTLRLAGYEVYRFGGYELKDQERAERTAKKFFDALFRRHGLLQ